MKNKRVAHGGATDSYAGRVGFRKQTGRARSVDHITVSPNGNFDGGDDFSDRPPVRLAAVALFARAPVHGERGGAGGGQRARHRHGVAGIIIPAEANFRRDRHVHRVRHRGDAGGRLRHVAQERRTVAVFDDFRDGTAHVKVNDVRARSRDDLRRLRQFFRNVSEELHRDRMLVFRQRQHAQRFFIVI